MRQSRDFLATHDGTRPSPPVPLEQLFSVAEQAAGVAAWDWDLIGDTLHWSPEVWSLFGIDPALSSSLERWRSALHPDDVEGASQLIADSIRLRQPFVTTYRIVLPSGQIRWIDAYGRAFHDASGRPARFSGICVDATARVQAEQGRHQAELLLVERQAVQRQLEQHQRCQAQMSHEIRTPVHAMLLLTEALASKDMPADASDLVHRMRDVAQVLRGLLDNALDLSRLEARQIEPERLAFDLGAVLDELASTFSTKAEKKGLAFRMTPPAPGWHALIGDSHRLAQVLRNLVGNAIQFTASGRVVLAVEALEQSSGWIRLRFVVEDSGVGIDPALQPRLFQPFAQSDASIGRQFGGAGLGLAICRELVELLGGQIGCDSVPGSGSRFWFTLPFARQPSPVPAVPESGSVVLPLPVRGVEPLAGVRILLVDDEPVGREVCAHLLAAAGAKVDQTGHGRAALDWLQQHPAGVDVVLMDLNMPVMGGLAAVACLRALPAWSDLPVLAMTADSQLQEREAALAAGMNDFLLKPFQTDHLVDTILRQLERRPVALAAESVPRVSLAGVVINADHGMAVCGGPQAYRHYLHRFSERYHASVAALQSRPANREDLGALAHQLKSTASYLGLERVAAVACEVEGALSACGSLEVVRQRLEAALIEALAAISEFLSRPPGGSSG